MLVPLADLRSGESILEAVAQKVVSFSDNSKPTRNSRQDRNDDSTPRSRTDNPLIEIRHALGEQPGLLILDNAEHMVPEVADAVLRLLEGVPVLSILVTSRQQLDITGERLIVLTSLPIPSRRTKPEHLMEYGSIALFVDRAQEVRPEFHITEKHAASIVAIWLFSHIPRQCKISCADE